jgi:hypothetical protein
MQKYINVQKKSSKRNQKSFKDIITLLQLISQVSTQAQNIIFPKSSYKNRPIIIIIIIIT